VEKQEILSAIEKGNVEFLKMKIAQGYSNVDGLVTKGEKFCLFKESKLLISFSLTSYFTSRWSKCYCYSSKRKSSRDFETPL
jgi:hypothetical protein